MSVFDIIKPFDINKGVQEFRENKEIVLVDVRSSQEYSQGHIPGSINIPLDSIEKIDEVASDKNALLYVHCLSGARSGRAVSILKSMGYKNVKNIGGIGNYRGELALR